MPTTTTNLGLQRPIVGGDVDAWGGFLNTTIDDLDAIFGSGGTSVSMGIVTFDRVRVQDGDLVTFGNGNDFYMRYESAGDRFAFRTSDGDGVGTDADLFTVDNGQTVIDFNSTPTVSGTAVTLVGHTHAAGDIASGTFANARISAGSVTQHQGSLSIGWAQLTGLPAFATRWPTFAEVTSKPTTLAGYGITDAAALSHTHAASAITSGTFANARISQSSVTQHQAALSIASTQITGTVTNTLNPGGIGNDAFVRTNGSGVLVDAVTSLTSGNVDTGLGTGDALGGWLTPAPATGSPGWNYGAVFQINDGSQPIQLAFGSTTKGRLAVRRRDSGTWYAWTEFSPTDHTHAAADVVSGTFANARIAQSNVTQHQAALSIDWTQVVNEPAFTTRWPTFAEVTATPTTLSGYGITDAVTSNTTQTVTGAKTFNQLLTIANANGLLITGVGEGLEIKNGGDRTGNATLGGHQPNDTRLINLRDANPAADGALLITADLTTTGDAADELLFISRTIFEWKGNDIFHVGNISSASIGWSQITSTPTTLAGYGITDAAASSHTHAASDVTSETFANARIAASNVTQHEAALSIGWGQLTGVPATFTPSAHTHSTADITSGTFADARIAQSNVTQHQAALSIAWTQVTGEPAFTTRWPTFAEVTSKPTTLSGYGISDGIASLNNVTITSVVTGELLRYNGTVWANATLGEAGVAAASHTHAAADVTSGTFADARVSQSSVTQHQAALSIGWAQLTGVPTYDNYVSFNVQVDAGAVEAITSGETLNFTAGTNITLSRTGASITINSTATGDVPSTRTITGTGALGGGGDLSANRTITHNTSAISPATYGGANNGIVIEDITVDTYGHITAIGTRDLDSRFANSSHTHSASDITSGTFANARISSGNVTQHQASLSIAWSQLTSVPTTFAPSAHTHVQSEINDLQTSDNVQFNGLGVGTTASATTGEIRATNDITAFFSDGRLKDIHGNISGALEKVARLNGVFYYENKLAKSFGFEGTKRRVGLIAQDVQRVLPEAIRPAPFDRDENDESASGEEYLTVKYENLVPLLVEAIKELHGKVRRLEGAR